MRAHRALILMASCTGLTAMSLPAGPGCETRVVFMKLAKNAGGIERTRHHTAGGSIWIARR